MKGNKENNEENGYEEDENEDFNEEMGDSGEEADSEDEDEDNIRKEKAKRKKEKRRKNKDEKEKRKEEEGKENEEDKCDEEERKTEEEERDNGRGRQNRMYLVYLMLNIFRHYFSWIFLLLNDPINWLENSSRLSAISSDIEWFREYFKIFLERFNQILNTPCLNITISIAVFTIGRQREIDVRSHLRQNTILRNNLFFRGYNRMFTRLGHGLSSSAGIPMSAVSSVYNNYRKIIGFFRKSKRR